MVTLVDKIKKSGIPFAEQAPMSGLSTFKIGGTADVLAEPETIEQVVVLASAILETKIDYVIIGGGSNILISDEGFRGVVIHPKLKKLEQQDNKIRAGSSISLQRFVQFCTNKGLSGVEHLVGIPGSVGGALVGNAGTAREWINSSIETVIVVNMTNATKEQFTGDECHYAYRNSIFKDSQERLIVEGVFRLTRKATDEIQKTMKEYLSRRSKQPSGSSSAGCVFKNPKEVPAGQLIDQLGLKGKRIGKAQIATDHGNFILNLGGAKATDIIKLISYVKQQARDKRGIQLQEEIRYIGF